MDDYAFKSFKFKAKLLENTEALGRNKILKHTGIAIPLKYLNNFWRSLEMLSINCKVELKHKWTNHCVLLIILFLLSKTQNYMSL